MKQIKFLQVLYAKAVLALLVCCCSGKLYAQNSMVGDGFGGRSWYVPHNFQVGAYSAYTVCGSNDQLYGWGRNLFGELGNGGTLNSNIPVPVIGMNNVQFYTTGYVSAVIKKDSTAWVWGTANSTSGFSGFTSTPALVLPGVKFADGGTSHVVFVKYDGTVWGAGQNTMGQLGNGITSSISAPTITPVQMTGITNAVRAVALGYGTYYPSATMILLSDSTVKLTGGNGWFSASNNTIPVTVAGLGRIVDIKGGATAAFALNADGEVYAFGKEVNGLLVGTLGLGASTGAYTPPAKIIFPPGAAPIIALSANNDGYSALALDENGNVYGWGLNQRGLLGDGTYINRETPVLSATNVIDIYAGETFSYILKADNSLWAAGRSRDAGGSIWMNLPDVESNVFTQIDPTISPMNLCAPKPFGVVPIQILNFVCTANGRAVNLNWRSAEEINFDRFIIEYSADAVHFREVEAIRSKGSNSNYNYVHQQVSGVAFYRLKMVDKDGRFTYSATRTVRLGSAPGFTIAPNPAKDLIHIYVKESANIQSVQVLSVNGSVLKTISNFNAGETIIIDDLPKGTYIIKAVDKHGEPGYGKVIKL